MWLSGAAGMYFPALFLLIKLISAQGSICLIKVEYISSPIYICVHILRRRGTFLAPHAPFFLVIFPQSSHLYH